MKAPMHIKLLSAICMLFSYELSYVSLILRPSHWTWKGRRKIFLCCIITEILSEKYCQLRLVSWILGNQRGGLSHWNYVSSMKRRQPCFMNIFKNDIDILNLLFRQVESVFLFSSIKQGQYFLPSYRFVKIVNNMLGLLLITACSLPLQVWSIFMVLNDLVISLISH